MLQGIVLHRSTSSVRRRHAFRFVERLTTMSRYPHQLQGDAVAPQILAETRPTILLAEDDAELRSIIADALRDEGCVVTEASDGGRMLVRVAREYGSSTHPQESFDLILSDICMPVCTGLQILEGLRRAHWHTPVI